MPNSSDKHTLAAFYIRRKLFKIVFSVLYLSFVLDQVRTKTSLKASVMSATLSPTATLDQSSARRRVRRDLRY